MQYFVSRHIGAHDWALRRGFEVQVVTHFDPEVVVDGDTVIGTLPIHLAAVVCSRGGRYFHLELNLPAEARGKELTADDMDRYGATIAEFVVTRR